MPETIKTLDLRPCDKCGGQLNPGGTPIFYRLRIEPFCLKPKALNQQLGLMQMLGGNPALAMAFAPDDTAAESHDDLRVDLLICSTCYLDDLNVAFLAESVCKKEEEQAATVSGGEEAGEG